LNFIEFLLKIDFVEFNHQSIAERRNAVEANKKKEIQLNNQVSKSIQELNGLYFHNFYFDRLSFLFDDFR
jgi:hypothetical protein